MSKDMSMNWIETMARGKNEGKNVCIHKNTWRKKFRLAVTYKRK